MSTTADIVQTLIEFGIEPDKAKHAAARYSDAERALNWCFEAGANWTPSQDVPPPPPPQPLALPLIGDGSVDKPIDMTLAGADMDNDEELRQAIAVSLAENGNVSGSSATGRATPANGYTGGGGGTVNFGPSTQEGTDQNALVSTAMANWDPSPPAFSTTEDKQMNEAMLASWHDSVPGSDTIFAPRTPGPRSAGAPLALYNPDPGMAFATSLVQALLALSSFREILTYSYPDPIPAPPPGSELAWLANCLPPQAWDDLQDLARRAEDATTTTTTKTMAAGEGEGAAASGGEDPESVLVGIESDGLWPRARRNTDPFEPASTLYEQIDEITGKALAAALIPQEGPLPPLLQSLRTTAKSPLRFFNFKTVQPLAPLGPTEEQAKLTIPCVTSATNTLHKAIASQLWPTGGGGDEQQRRWAIDGSGPRALAVFLAWPKSPPLGGRVPFELEEIIYVDRYLRRNFQQVFRLQASEGVLRLEEDELASRRAKLTTVKGKDVRSHLINAIGYYETLAPAPAEDGGAEERPSATSHAKLKKILAELDAEVARLGERLADVQTKRAGLFDGADLKKCPLELKAVLVHNGLHSTGSVYAYVRHATSWFRIIDGTSTAVPFAAVQADQSGLHLGAGVFGAVYERGEGWIAEEEEEVEEEEGEGGGPATARESEEPQPMDEDPPSLTTTAAVGLTGASRLPETDGTIVDADADANAEDESGQDVDVDRMLGVVEADGTGGGGEGWKQGEDANRRPVVSVDGVGDGGGGGGGGGAERSLEEVRLADELREGPC